MSQQRRRSKQNITVIYSDISPVINLIFNRQTLRVNGKKRTLSTAERHRRRTSYRNPRHKNTWRFGQTVIVKLTPHRDLDCTGKARHQTSTRGRPAALQQNQRSGRVGIGYGRVPGRPFADPLTVA